MIDILREEFYMFKYIDTRTCYFNGHFPGICRLAGSPVILCYPYPEHPYGTDWNSLHPHATLGCTCSPIFTITTIWRVLKQMPFMSPSQQCQGTEGKWMFKYHHQSDIYSQLLWSHIHVSSVFCICC